VTGLVVLRILRGRLDCAPSTVSDFVKSTSAWPRGRLNSGPCGES
jgi:hypothetical protein